MVEKRRRLKSHEHSFEAVPAVVVADKTDRLGKRLGIAAIAGLVLFFVIAGYIQSAKNGSKIKPVPSPTVIVKVTPVPVPAKPSLGGGSNPPAPPPVVIVGSPGANGQPGANGRPGQNGRPANSPKPAPKPTSKPSPNPSPSRTPNPVGSIVCTIVNCPRSANEQPRTGPATQAVRLSQVGSTSAVACLGYFVCRFGRRAASAKSRRGRDSDSRR